MIILTILGILWSSYGSIPAEPRVLSSHNGLASYYSDIFHEKKTASGELYDTSALTAAHLSLPFGQKLRITNQSNGRQVIVKVNDRGPFNRKRLVDLSKEAAKKLDMVDSGIANIQMELLSD